MALMLSDKLICDMQLGHKEVKILMQFGYIICMKW